MTAETVIYAARTILTMDPACPRATHVAVREGRVLAVGDEAHCRLWDSPAAPARLDETFKDLVLMPGMVEGHSHATAGTVWQQTYTGYFDRTDPDGKLWPGCKTLEAVVQRLREAEAALPDPDATLHAWGFDPIYFDNLRIGLAEMDAVSTRRPVLLSHSNGHVANANSVLLKKAGIDAGTNVHGIIKDAAGQPTGEVAEMAALYMVRRAAGGGMHNALENPAAVRRYAQAANRVGVTCATDLFAELRDRQVEAYRTATASEDFPLVLVPALNALGAPAAEGVARIQALRKLNNERLRFGLVKLMTDGSIQGFSGRLKWPGYMGGKPNGLWNTAPEELFEVLHTFHAAGIQCHIHTNGDEASEVTIDAIEAALHRTPRWDHRHTLQHCQMADTAQFRRMKALGICANLFLNHVYYWGEQHAAFTMGPDRARRMDAAATALREGVALAMHSDAPVTPLGPLFTAWCAVNRLTAENRVLGPEERIPVAAALRAITLGAAWTLKLDHELGSIEVGKRADFAVLEEDPEAVAPWKLKDVPVWGTVVGGRLFPV